MNEENRDKLIFEFHSTLLKVGRRTFKKMRRSFSDFGIPFNQFHLLQKIQKKDKINLSTLSSHSHMKKGNVSRAIDSLVRDGLVAREKGQEDRRVVFLILTEKGTQRLQEIQKTQAKMLKKIYKNFPTDKLSIYIETIKDIKKYMEGD